KEPGARALSALPGLFEQGFYWYRSSVEDEVVLMAVAQYLERRALNELRKEQGITYSPHATFRRMAGGGSISLAIATDRAPTASVWYTGVIEEVRTTSSPLALLQPVLTQVADQIDADSIRTSLAVLRQEQRPDEALRALDDARIKRVVSTHLTRDRVFGR